MTEQEKQKLMQQDIEFNERLTDLCNEYGLSGFAGMFFKGERSAIIYGSSPGKTAHVHLLVEWLRMSVTTTGGSITAHQHEIYLKPKPKK